MKVKALVSFAGIVSMGENEIAEISNDEVVKDLVKAGFIEIMADKAEKAVKSVENKRSNKGNS